MGAIEAPSARALERAYFKLMTDNAKAFWAAVIAVYAAAAAIGFKPTFKCVESGSGTAISQSSPAWAKLAAIQSGSPQPPADMLARFQRAFGRLEHHCPDTPDRIGDFIVAGERQLSNRGKQTSLLELTEAVVTMLDTAESSGGVAKMNSCAEPVALMVTGLLPR
jgi:hypothetical protein